MIELAQPELHPFVERLFLIDVVSYDWNCSQYITRRFAETDVAKQMGFFQARIAQLEAKLHASNDLAE